MMKRIALFTGILLAGAVIGYGAGLLHSRSGEPAATSKAERKVVYWRAPMDPNFRSDKPGKSPMGMDLIPVYEGEEDSAGASSVHIDPSVVNNIGVRTATVESAALRRSINTVGRIVYDEKKLANIHLRSSGWIERLAVRSEGEPVAKGELLFEVYSPELVNAQAEFLQTMRTGDPALINAGKDRLRALNISGEQIEALEKTRRVAQYVKFFAPIDGVVTKLNVADGEYFKPDTLIMSIADLSTVWLMSDVFEADSDQLRIGAKVTAQSKFEPGAVLAGTVDYIYPDLEPVTRTIPVRTVFDNSDGKLKPGMFMTVSIEGPARPRAAVIPRLALIRTGRVERVILALGDGRFQPAAVTSGIEADGKVEILAGLKAGETVVVSGQFLIDSESSFAGAALRMAPPKDAHQQHSAAPSGAKDRTPNGPDGRVRRLGITRSEQTSIRASGVIKKVSAPDKTITIDHEAIPEIGWPAMTMDFRVASAVDLTALKNGEHIRFALAPAPDNSFIVQSVESAR